MLRIPFRMRHRRMAKASGRLPDGHGTGPAGRILKLRQLVTALIRHERIEGDANHMYEARGYAELLIQSAQKHGDQHQETMELADYWLLEKDLVHKLFKVLAPRYNNYGTSFTSIYRLPSEYPGFRLPLALLELKGNPWPPVIPNERDMSGSLVNILLDEARREFRERQKEKLETLLKVETEEGVEADCGTASQVEDLSSQEKTGPQSKEDAHL